MRSSWKLQYDKISAVGESAAKPSSDGRRKMVCVGKMVEKGYTELVDSVVVILTTLRSFSKISMIVRTLVKRPASAFTYLGIM